MKEGLKSKFDNQEKSAEEIAQAPMRIFINENFDLIHNLNKAENAIHELVKEIERNHLKLGELDRKRVQNKMDLLKNKEALLLDKLVDKFIRTKIDVDALDSDEFFDFYDDLLPRMDLEINEEDVEEDEDEVESDDESEKADEDIDSQESYYEPDVADLIKRRIKEQRSASEINENRSEINEIENEEQERLKKVRELINTPKGKESSDDVFDAQRKFIEISKFSAKDNGAENLAHYLALKKKLISRYKKELYTQAIGIREINHFLEDEICKSTELNFAQIYFQFENLAKEYKLSQWQIERYKGVFDKFEEGEETNRKDWEKYKNMDGAEVGKDFFGFPLQGEVKIEKHAIVTIFTILNRDDFARIYSKKDVHEKLTKEDYDNLDDLGGFYKLGAIFINNNCKHIHNKRETISKHEIKHVINELIDSGLYGKNSIARYENAKMNAYTVKEYFENELSYSLYRAKDEILAYLKGEEDIDDIRILLLEKDGYDYLTERKYIKSKGEDDDEDYDGEELFRYDEKEIKKELNDCKLKYEKIVIKCLDVLKELDVYGLSREKMVAIFQLEPMEKWEKISRRLIENPQFIEERRKDIEERTKATKEELQKYRRDNSWLKRKIDKLKAKLPFGLSRKFSDEIFDETLLELDLKELGQQKTFMQKNTASEKK